MCIFSLSIFSCVHFWVSTIYFVDNFSCGHLRFSGCVLSGLISFSLSRKSIVSTPVYGDKRTHAHTRTCTRARTQIHTRRHTHTHTHTCTRTHKHTRTHPPISSIEMHTFWL